MNENDLKKLENLNERYTTANMTGFKLVNEKTSRDTVLKHIELDLKILNSNDLITKHVSRVIIRSDCIDICTVDNGTYASYFFTEDAKFTAKSLKEDVMAICSNLDVHFENIN